MSKHGESKLCTTSLRTATKVSEVIEALQSDFVDLGNLKNDGAALSVEDKRFMKILNENKEVVDGHLQLPLPFKSDMAKLPDNKVVAFKRLESLKSKFNKKERFATQYKKFNDCLVDEGQAEAVPEEETANAGWYLPHHGVYHNHKPGKLRVVLDCAARYQGVSLNDVLLQGPNLMNSLIGVLLRFRKERIAFIGDIKSMFYQVRVAPQHRDFLRFLWWESGDVNKAPKEFRMLVHVFGAKSSPGCANYSLKDVAKRLSDKYGQDALEFVQNNFYVDDGLQSVETADEAIDLIQRTVAMLKEGGFKLHEFLSNSKQVLKALPDDCIASNVSQKDLKRTLGILWDPTLDVFTFEGNMKENPPTRRGILSTVSAVFDPLGLIGPYILQGKRILQNVCAEGKDWDEPLNDDTIQHWIAWKEELQYLSNIKISRCYKAPNAT
ncbi:uncharacterized protein LOC117105399 [Anneissia japonica]|uniref:uncharacterized protein LOC117105399 n=1 Tax=Anneissia japonica TaxID=1529436 RepID=UPI0014258CAB|nr:uncharacterized protein LOC117105399 [Anneissia japonica]